MEERELDQLLRQIGMHPDCCRFDACEQSFRAGMLRGLAGDRSGMMMLPTFISADGTVPRGEKILVLDAGGTNLRRAVAWFDENGKIVIDRFERYPMPGTRGELSVEAFFDEIAGHLLPVLDESDRLSFCFSYATQALPNMDGRLQHFCKEVHVRDSEGIEVCAELQKALRRKGVTKPLHCVLLNDSVAALLGGKAFSEGRNFDSFLGYVYGTGTNCCYVEETQNIADAESYRGDSMIVNMESGIHVGFPMGEADTIVDLESEFPGDHLYEKMISGAYLGRLMAVTAVLCAEHGAFTPEGAAILRNIQAFDLRDAGDFMSGAELPALFGMPESDKRSLRQIMDRLYDRAARLMAVTIACVLTWISKGRTKERPCCVTVEGTTFRKSRVLREHFFQYEKTYLNQEKGVYIELLECEDTTLTGTAIAGLLNTSKE